MKIKVWFQHEFIYFLPTIALYHEEGEYSLDFYWLNLSVELSFGQHKVNWDKYDKALNSLKKEWDSTVD